MRRYLIGTIFGFVLATAVGANAQEANKLIDSIVQAVVPVTVEGTSVGEGIIVNDTTYLPVREFGEAVGYTVTFTEDREVVMTKNTVPDPVQVPGSSNSTSSKSIDEQIASINKTISDIQGVIETNKGVLQSNVAFAERYNTNIDDLKKIVDTINASIATAEARIAEYREKIVELEAQK